MKHNTSNKQLDSNTAYYLLQFDIISIFVDIDDTLHHGEPLLYTSVHHHRVTMLSQSNHVIESSQHLCFSH
jgi:hypothetical protein